MITLIGCLFIYVVAAVLWAVGWYSEYENNPGEYYAEERKTAARNFLLTPVGPVLWVVSFVVDGTRAMAQLIKDAFRKDITHD